jgi:hypothetical protein
MTLTFYDRLAEWIRTEGLETAFNGAAPKVCLSFWALQVFDHQKALKCSVP